MGKAADEVIWKYARENDFTIISKDSDFHELSFLRGFPPKVIWLRVGNCSTQQIETLVRKSHSEISAFGQHATESCLILGL